MNLPVLYTDSMYLIIPVVIIASLYLPITRWLVGDGFSAWHLLMLWGIPAVLGWGLGWAVRRESA